MTSQIEALKMAIEAMKYHIEQTRPITSTCIAINVCKEALAQPTIRNKRTVKNPVRTGFTYCMNDDCEAEYATSPDCICWTPNQSPPESVVLNNQTAQKPLSDEEITDKELK